jgi:hypothetical protein
VKAYEELPMDVVRKLWVKAYEELPMDAAQMLLEPSRAIYME